MQSTPPAADIVASVISFLQDVAVPGLSGRDAFDAKVAVRALGIVQRHLALADPSQAREMRGLQLLLPQQEGSVEILTELLCEGIRQGHVDLNTPGLADHLWNVTLDKLAIDQPTYPAYRAHQSLRQRNKAQRE
jgi:hypothetical protein